MAGLHRSERRFWLRLGGSLVGLYLLISALAWLAADSLIFFPQYASRSDPPDARSILMKDGTRLAAVYLPHPNARFTIWYFHGNAESLDDTIPRLRELNAFGFSVFSVEYPGYGASGGASTERAIYATLQPTVEYLKDELRVSPGGIIIYGRSLGGGPAVELASQMKVAGLVLESTFTSTYRVKTHWPVLVGDRFNNVRKLPGVLCPVFVIHGRDDHVIPFSHGEALFEKASNPLKQHLWVDFAGHNDLRHWAGESYREALINFQRKL